MKCPKCGFENKQNAQSCPKCGQSLLSSAPGQNIDYSYNFWPALILGIIFIIMLVISKLFYK
jgi:uncharacterized paraquat-inducible protein A